MITTVVLDLDGVVRHFDPAHGAEIEARHGVESGALLAAAFTPDVLMSALTGEITHGEWVRQIGALIKNPQAAREWSSDRGSVDWDVIEIVAGLRRGGSRVAVLTNGTSLIPQDFTDLGLATSFDAVFNSAEIGFAKPDVRVFAHVCDCLAVEPHHVFFTDDSASNLSGAIELGMTARRFESVDGFRNDLRDLAIELGAAGHP